MCSEELDLNTVQILDEEHTETLHMKRCMISGNATGHFSKM